MSLTSRIGATALAALLGTASTGVAQPTQIFTETLLEADGATAGATVRAALQVQLNAGFHVNSNTPLEDFLIPTALTVTPPDGVGVGEIVYPDAGLLEQVGADMPLAVFEEYFTIGVAFDVAAGLAPGTYAIPGTLRYQACDETMCYLPANADVKWMLRIVPSGTTIARQHADLFDGLTFGGENSVMPTAAAPAASVTVKTIETADVDVLLAEFDVLGTTGGYLNRDDFLGFMSAAESGEGQKGWFEGRGPLAILALILLGGLALNLTPCVLPMIPINIASHRSGRAGRLAPAGSAAGRRLRRGHGCRLRRAGPDRHSHRRHVRHDQLVAMVQPGHHGTVRRAGPRDVRRAGHRLLTLPVEAQDRQQRKRLVRGGHSAWAPSPRCWPARAWRRSSSRSSCSRATCTRRARRLRSYCRSASASAWRCPGPSQAPVSRSCRSQVPGW